MEESKIKILSVFSSFRQDSFSSFLHNSFLENKYFLSGSIDRIYLAEENINFCTACGVCATGKCCIATDSMTAIYDKIADADILTVSFPVYFSTVPAQLKVMIDRCQFFWEKMRRGEKIKSKKAMLVCTSGKNYDGVFDSSVKTIKHFFKTINADYLEKYSVFIHSTDTFDEFKKSEAAHNLKHLSLEFD